MEDFENRVRGKKTQVEEIDKKVHLKTTMSNRTHVAVKPRPFKESWECLTAHIRFVCHWTEFVY